MDIYELFSGVSFLPKTSTMTVSIAGRRCEFPYDPGTVSSPVEVFQKFAEDYLISRGVPISRPNPGRILVLSNAVMGDENWIADHSTNLHLFRSTMMGHLFQKETKASAIIRHVEDNLVLVQMAPNSSSFVRDSVVTVGDGRRAGCSPRNLLQIFDSDAGHQRVFCNYGGHDSRSTTFDHETLTNLDVIFGRHHQTLQQAIHASDMEFESPADRLQRLSDLLYG